MAVVCGNGCNMLKEKLIEKVQHPKHHLMRWSLLLQGYNLDIVTFEGWKPLAKCAHVAHGNPLKGGRVISPDYVSSVCCCSDCRCDTWTDFSGLTSAQWGLEPSLCGQLSLTHHHLPVSTHSVQCAIS